MADPKRRATPKGGKKGDKEKRLAEVRRIVSESGLTIEDVFPDGAAMTGGGDCNPCFEESAGILYCDGANPRVEPFPPGNVPVVPVFKNGVLHGWANATAFTMVEAEAPPVEAAPPPRENGGSEQTLM